MSANTGIFHNDVKRFWLNVKKSDGCWLWTGYCNKYRFGYGSFWNHGKPGKAHRFSWEIHNGPIPKGMQVLHDCDNPPCVRPDHLFLGTQLDNLNDMRSKGRGFVPPAGTAKWELHGNARLTKLQVREIRALAIKAKTHLELAERFGVSRTQISRIIRNERWRELA